MAAANTKADGLARPNARLGQPCGKSFGTSLQLAVAQASYASHDGNGVRISCRRVLYQFVKQQLARG